MDALTPPDMLQTAPMSPAEQMAAMPPDVHPVTHDVTIVTTKKLAQAKVLGVPPEEFGIEKGARNIRDCNYCFHEVVTKTKSQLIAEGFDEQQIKSLGDYNSGTTNVETLARDSVGENFTFSSGVNTAARLVKITEHYVRMDYEGKGRPCLYMVVTGGDQGEVLKRDGKELIDPIDVIPFAATTPVPITHRFVGRSIADLVMPAQREKTALKRGALDNIYLANNPRIEVPEAAAGPNTLDDLLVSRPGGIVRTKGNGGMLQWQKVPDVTAGIYPMIQYIDAELETRTGLSKQSQGIDANALQNQSATAVAQVFSASQMRVKLIARIMAEGVRDIFALLHHTIRSHGQKEQTVRLRNSWVNVDPRNWKTRDDMTINVGLGSGGKAQQFAQMMAIGNIQKEMVAAGQTQIVDPDKIYNLAAEITKIAGHKNASRFFNDPSEKGPDGQPKYPPPQPAQDPKLQVEQMKQQGKQAEIAQQSQLDQQKAQLDAYHEQVQAAADLQVKQFAAQVQERLAILDGHIKVVLAEQKMRHDQQAHHAKIVGTVVDLAATADKHNMTMEHGAESHALKMAAAKAKPEKPNG